MLLRTSFFRASLFSINDLLVKLPYDSVCPSVGVERRLVCGPYVITFDVHFHAPIGAIVIPNSSLQNDAAHNVSKE